MFSYKQPNFKEIQKFFMKSFKVKSVKNLDIKAIEAKDWVMSCNGAEWNLTVKDGKVNRLCLTDVYREKQREINSISELLEKRATSLKPGYENYTYSHEEQKVYYGNDWDHKPTFYTVEQLTSGYEKEQEIEKQKFEEHKKTISLFSYNDILQYLDKWAEISVKSSSKETKFFSSYLLKKVKKKWAAFEKNKKRWAFLWSDKDDLEKRLDSSEPLFKLNSKLTWVKLSEELPPIFGTVPDDKPLNLKINNIPDHGYFDGDAIITGAALLKYSIKEKDNLEGIQWLKETYYED